MNFATILHVAAMSEHAQHGFAPSLIAYAYNYMNLSRGGANIIARYRDRQRLKLLGERVG